MSTTVCFTKGHISIRRGRVTKPYRNPTLSSIRRLSNLTFYGAADGHTTQRSSIYTWFGLSTLTKAQKDVLDLYVRYVFAYKNLELKVEAEQSERQCCAYQTRDYINYYSYIISANALMEACRIAGIHRVLIEAITPCEHGHPVSRCYTCATMY